MRYRSRALVGRGGESLAQGLMACAIASAALPCTLAAQAPAPAGGVAWSGQAAASGLAVSLSDPRLWARDVAPGESPRPWSRTTRAAELDAGAPRPWARKPQSAEPDAGGAGWGAEFWVPFFSTGLPGLGQYVRGAGWQGAAFTAAAVGGYVLAGQGRPFDEDVPREARNQLAYEGAHVAFTAGLLSAWDAFHRAVPALQAEGKYDFLGTRESVGDLMTAPVDVRFLSRWTTWVSLGFTATVTTLILANREDGVAYEPFRGHDAAYAASLSYNAGVGEEALFRGWLLPVLYQKLGRDFWEADVLQGLIFAALHLPQAGGYARVIGLWAVYDGWLTRHNGWSVRESVFSHFWYDAAVSVAELLDDRQGAIQLPAVTIRF